MDYTELKTEIKKYLTGEIKAGELKHSAAPFGIYQQRNDLFMIRIRVVGGELDSSGIRLISGIMKQFDVGYSHITTRQDLQFHDVKAENIIDIILTLSENGFPFRGGGGNTFRNIIVATDSGVSENSVFDVYPYAKALNKYMMNYDKAFDLPRKLKIGFSSYESDSLPADLQDLGFIARNYRNEKGFKVYAAGGMGRESRYGIKLFDYLPLNKVAQCAKAITDLFYDHGNREDRNNARLRFVLNRFGEDEFINLFQDYYIRSMAELPDLDEFDFDKEISKLKTEREKTETLEGYTEWAKYAITPTRFGDGVVSLKLFISKGDLDASELDKINNILDITGCSSLRLSPSQDVIFPLVNEDSLLSIYSILKKDFKSKDVVLDSFHGHILSCVGAEVCKIGIVNAPAVANMIADALDKYFEGKTSSKAAFIKSRLSDMRISGCPNTCSGHFAAKIALCGMKKRIGGDLVEGVLLKEDGIEGERFVPLSDIPEVVIKALII